MSQRSPFSYPPLVVSSSSWKPTNGQLNTTTLVKGITTTLLTRRRNQPGNAPRNVISSIPKRQEQSDDAASIRCPAPSSHICILCCCSHYWAVRNHLPLLSVGRGIRVQGENLSKIQKEHLLGMHSGWFLKSASMLDAGTSMIEHVYEILPWYWGFAAGARLPLLSCVRHKVVNQVVSTLKQEWFLLLFQFKITLELLAASAANEIQSHVIMLGKDRVVVRRSKHDVVPPLDSDIILL